MSTTKAKRPVSRATRAKLSAAARARWQDPKFRAVMAARWEDPQYRAMMAEAAARGRESMRGLNRVPGRHDWTGGLGARTGAARLLRAVAVGLPDEALPVAAALVLVLDEQARDVQH